ncbi:MULTISPECIES: acyl carrier protein [unclassified Streptomyces]|uniref:acyl carrier protein n=1 Tax=unclassified Streptomyces TaxID=2593676 RepID=UPI002E7803CB|nr:MULTISPECIES: acyl carrier protein [unclassified Streptomyces]MEE1758263.1 acyl carrier protein [Streptomyces sp. SP18BB07]MEE1832681.1 acyl carrier protein [Streptomyces sp. SP17KL33]
MSQLTIDDLRRILVEAAGADDGIDLSGDILDTSFEDLGYDSLALMESAAKIKQEYGVDLSDDAIGDVETPRALLDLVNGTTVATA